MNNLPRAEKMSRVKKISITIPQRVLAIIDHKRGDVARSRYIRRALEDYAEIK